MVSAEIPSGKTEENDFSSLKYMKGVREALEAQITEAYGTLDLDRLGQAPPENQKSLIERAFEAARAKYTLEENHDKLKQLEEVKVAIGEGRLTLTGLLEGLGLKEQQAVKEERHSSFFDRVRRKIRI